MDREASNFVQLKLRLREGTRERLDAAAELSGRSLNSELVARLEHSLLLDAAHGGAEQARIITGLVSIMDEVSAEYGGPWWNYHSAWWLVRRACWYLILQYRPDRPNLAELLSPRGKLTVQQWKDEYARHEKSRLEAEGHRLALAITHKVMRDPYTATRLLELEDAQLQPAPTPNLDDADKEIWLKMRNDEITMAGAWLQSLPILQAIRRRRRKLRASS